MTYLDGNLSSNGLDDPALDIQMFHLPWWTGPHSPTGISSYLSRATIKSALDDYRRQLGAAMPPIGKPHSIHNLADELNKPGYTWHSSANDLPNIPNNNCTRCRLYRAVAVGVMDQVRDTYNMAHGCEVANEAEKDIGIRRASGFNELFEAVLKKECDAGELAAGSGLGREQQRDSEGEQQQDSESGSDKQQFGPEVEGLKKLIKKLVMEAGGMASSKWTWGVDLTEDDLRSLIRGADRQHQVPHSGYDQDLSSGALRSQTSEALDPVNLEDPKDGNLRFDDVSISTIPDLGPHEFPRFQSYWTHPKINLASRSPIR